LTSPARIATLHVSVFRGLAMMVRGVAFLVVLASVAACAPKTVVDYRVSADEGASLQSVSLDLCGERVELSREGDVFSASVTPRCEGAGRIQAVFVDGGRRDCEDDYVTSGLGAVEHRWIVSPQACRREAA
jgi:hypothetical protein